MSPWEPSKSGHPQAASGVPPASVMVWCFEPSGSGRRCLTGSNGSIRPHGSSGTLHGSTEDRSPSP